MSESDMDTSDIYRCDGRVNGGVWTQGINTETVNMLLGVRSRSHVVR